MRPRVAIPQPSSLDPDYSARSFPQYAEAVRRAGGEPVEVPADATPEHIGRIIRDCQGALLPGSRADVDPEKYGQARHPRTAAPDPRRDNVDELLLQDAYNMRKPLFGICYGLQILNVWRTGTLLQHLETGVRHDAGREVARAHRVVVPAASLLGAIVAPALAGVTAPSIVPGEEDAQGHGPVEEPEQFVLEVNSSHHQAPEQLGDGLRAVAWCPDDKVVEAVEGTQPGHFVLGVQWHPERSDDTAARALFAAFVAAAGRWQR